MVKHKNDPGTYNRLDYKRRPYSEYRTIVHVTVQLLQPKTKDGDPTGWQHVADIFNHIFANDLDEQNVRRQGAVFWRDQYVHHDKPGRPKEWMEILKPEDQLTAEERQRRAGYRGRIRQAAQDLAIVVQNPPSASDTSAPTASGAQTERKRNGAATLDNDKPTEQQSPKKPRSADLEKTEKKDFEEEWDGKRWEKINERSYYRQDTETPKFNLPGSSTNLDRYGASTPFKINENTTGAQTRESIAADEAYARSLQIEENQSRPVRRKIATSSSSFGDWDGDDLDMSAAAPGRQHSLGAFEPQPIPRWTAEEDAKLEGIKEKIRSKKAGTDEPSQYKTSKLTPKQKKSVPAKKKTIWQKSGKVVSKPMSAPSKANGNRKATASATKADATWEGDYETLLAPSDLLDPANDTNFASRSSTGLSRGTAPALTMIHGRGETRWYDGVPYVRKGVKREDTPAICRSTSLMAKRCGMVVRGVLDGKEEDVMVCISGECSWCDSKSTNSALGSTDRRAIGRPLVHSCCLQYDAEYEVYEFVPTGGVGEEWEKKFPEDVVELKVQFSDFMTRNVYVCVKEKCYICKKT